MASVLSVIQKIDEKYKKENILNSGLIALGTTEFVLNDKNADLKSLVEQINQNVPDAHRLQGDGPLSQMADALLL